MQQDFKKKMKQTFCHQIQIWNTIFLFIECYAVAIFAKKQCITKLTIELKRTTITFITSLLNQIQIFKAVFYINTA